MLQRLCLLLPVLFLVPAWASAAENKDAAQPNFVWLISEDNSKHFLKLFDPTGAPTPNIAGLAKEGLIFEHAFSNAPVCSVARTTLITSCYGPRIFTQFHRRSVLAPMPQGVKMFPAYLRDAGYYTTNNSKTDYNAIAGKNVWDESSRKAHWRNRKAGQPFFHKQSFGASHESSLHFPASVMKVATTTDPQSVVLPPYHPDTKTFRYTYARYHDRIREIDRQIGQVVQQLKDDNLMDSTFIFYFGDHGGVLPRGKGYAYESGLHVPLVVYTPPKFRHLSPFAADAKVQGFVSFVDFGPTLLNLAGIKPPAGIDGVPFLGEGISESEVNSRDEAFGYADRFDEKYDLVRTLRKGRYKYIRNLQPFNFDSLQNNYRYKMLAYQEWRKLYREGELNAVQSQFFRPRAAEALYDLKTDPHETVNLASEPSHAATLAMMRLNLTNRMKNMPDLSMLPESELVANVAQNPVATGQKRKEEIAALVDIANYCLQPFEKSRPRIAAALESDNEWKRYWGLIVCSCFGKQAAEFYPSAKKLAAEDENQLVRVRAAEFLALTGAAQPQAVILDALSKVESPTAGNLILNTLVLLRDGKPGYKFAFDPANLQPTVRKNSEVQRRIAYLTGQEWVKPKKKPKPKKNAAAQ